MKNYNEMTDEELNQELDFITIERKKRRVEKEEREFLKLIIKGFTCKDIAVRYGHIPEYHGDDERYSFYVKYNGKLWDFYYGKSDQGAGDWWPEPEDEMFLTPLTKFIPAGFSEACENAYMYRGTHEQALEQLKKHGITDIEKADW